MAQFLIRNSLNPNKVVKLGITFKKVTDKNRYDGESIWVVEVGTSEPHKNGGLINPVLINLITLDKFDEEVKKAATYISSQIDWGNLLEDDTAPYVDSVYPVEYELDIDDFVEFILKEDLPSAGIDLSSIKLYANDFDITGELEITGNPYEYKIKWRPKIKIYSTYL